MVTRIRVVIGMLICLGFVAGCSSKGPVAEKPPTVEVSQLNSTVITPQLVKFQARIIIHNRSSRELGFDRVDYAVDLQGQELFTSSFSELLRTRKGKKQTVTFHFQISMEDILDQSVAILAEGGMDVGFRGMVYPEPASGFSPLAFRSTIAIPVPEIPEVAFGGTEGVPMSREFVVKLRIMNTNGFEVTVNRIESYLEINQVQYQLLHTEQVTSLEPHRWETIELTMENTTGKTLSLILNTLQSPNMEFRVGGTVECRSPYGWIVFPIALPGQD
jgi:LEA14-like dessication related protein